jgi:hypothetical protein
MTFKGSAMSKFKMGITVAIVAASVLGSLALQHQGERRLREREESWRRQTEALARLSAENERLSNLVARVKTSQPLSKPQLAELLRLRNEAGRLRQSETEKARLQAENARLRAAAARAAKQLAEARAAPNYWAKDQLAFAGYADPQSAMRSMLAAMKSGDLSSWQASCTPDANTDLQREWKQRGLSQEQQEGEIKAMADTLMSSSEGFHILNQTNPSPDEAVVNLSFDGEGVARKFVLRKIENEWKLQDLLLNGQAEPASQ